MKIPFSCIFVLFILKSYSQKIDTNIVPSEKKEINIDAITGATPCYYDSLSIKEMIDIIKKSDEAHVLSTVNIDGTPNAAYMEANIADEKILFFYIDIKSLTRKNIDRTGYAMFSFYIRVEGGKTWKDKYKGGRFLLKKVTDSEKIEKLKKTNINNNSEELIFLEIIKIVRFS